MPRFQPESLLHLSIRKRNTRPHKKINTRKKQSIFRTALRLLRRRVQNPLQIEIPNLPSMPVHPWRLLVFIFCHTVLVATQNWKVANQSISGQRLPLIRALIIIIAQYVAWKRKNTLYKPTQLLLFSSKEHAHVNAHIDGYSRPFSIVGSAT